MHEAYLSWLPAELRPNPLPPRESTWWRWRDCLVHVERAGDRDAPTRAVALHGVGGHAAALWPYVAIAAHRGMHVVVPDLPGYGRTRVSDRGALRYGDWIELACDLVEAERRDHDGRLVLIGASLGGTLAYDVATRTGLVDHIVATCLFDPREPVARRHVAHLPWIGLAAPTVLRAVAGPLARLPVPLRWLTNMRAIANDPGLTELVLRDTRGGGNRMPLGFLRSVLTSAPAVEPENATGPSLVLAHPAADRWTPVEASRRFFDRLAAPKELVLLDNAGHYPVEPPGTRRLVDVIAAAAG